MREDSNVILRVKLDLPEDLAYLRMTREVSRTILDSLQAVSVDIDDADTLISELYANVMRHGRSDGGRFVVTLEFGAGSMAVSVVDCGPGFSPDSLPPPGARPDMDGGERIGGYGLAIVKAISDDIEFSHVDHPGSTVRAVKKFRYRSESAAEAASCLDVVS